MKNTCALDGPADFLGKPALCQIKDQGYEREIRGIVFNGEPCPPCSIPWPVMAGGTDGEQIGQITSAAYSPRLSQNVGLSMIERSHWHAGQEIMVLSAEGKVRPGIVSQLPILGPNVCVALFLQLDEADNA